MSQFSLLTSEAEADLAEAFDWYEQQQRDLGREFVAKVEEYLDRILRNPRQYQEVHQGVRRAVMSRFPYSLFYLLDEGEVVVLAVEHQARHPERWKKRL